MLRTRVPPGWTNESKPFVHEGEECVHLLSGGLDVVVGSECFALAEGDSITYESLVPHWYVNPTNRPAVLLGAVTPPSF